MTMMVMMMVVKMMMMMMSVMVIVMVVVVVVVMVGHQMRIVGHCSLIATQNVPKQPLIYNISNGLNGIV